MAETHELRLKINAAAARAGSREFVGAIENIKRAVIDLERASDGTFKRLSKNARDAGKAANVKIDAVDRTAIRNLDEFAKIQAQVIRQTATSRNGLTGLMDGLRNVTGAYASATGRSDGYGTSITRTNTALTRQVQLLAQIASASRRTGAQASPQATTQTTQTDRAAQQQVAMQNRVKRAVDDTRLATERLVTQLMKVGGFSQINSVSRAFRDFQKEVSRTSVTTAELDAAKTRLNSSMRNAQTAVVTLTAKEQENARATREAAAAARAHEEAVRRQNAATREAATSARQQATEMERQQSVALSSAAALRRASEETARLSERMRRIGDTRGLASINAALNTFRTNVGNGVTSATQLRTAISQFGASASNAKISLTQMEGTQRRAAESARTLASQQRDAANQARRVEREMRSVAGASSAASRAFREASGSMRGMENAFSATYQIGSAFRILMGSFTMGTFIQSVFQAGAALEQFRVTMEVATGSVAGAADQMDFIDDMARTLGTNLRTARDDFSKFAVSANLAGVEADTARGIFRSVSSAMTVMGRGAEDQRLAFLALEQMLSKNVVSSEELRRQLGERLPGAVNLMARAVGVSTQELNKMLKAGELISSEVLPAFAREVDAAFGPGLAASLERAPAALGRFRNELEFFMSTVADSGFMTALADGFDTLTESMRSEEMQDVAQRLGSGLADLTQIAVDFAVVFVENIETVGRVAKAVVAGLLVRQFVLLGNAVITSAQRASIGFATLTASMAGNNAAAQSNTVATVANNNARRFSAAQIAATSAAFDVNTVRQNLNTVAANTNAAAQTRLGRAVSVAGAAAGRAGTAMGVATRVLGGLAGPIGLAVTAISLLPLLFGDTSNGADEMASRIEAAIRRSGASLEQFEQQAQRATSSIRLLQTIDDIEVLEVSLSEFRRTATGEIDAINMAFASLRDGTELSFDRARFDTQLIEGLFGPDAIGMLNDLSGATQDTVQDILGAAQEAIESGEGFLALRGRIAEAMSVNPSTEGLLRPIMELTEQLALSEAGSVRLRASLVDVYGSADDRLLKVFADTAQTVVQTGDGVDDLRNRMNSMMGDSPHLAAEFQQIFDQVGIALRTGMGAEAFGAIVLDVFDDSVNAIAEMRAAIVETEADVVEAGQNMGGAIASFDSLLRNSSSFLHFGEGVVQEISRASAALDSFDDFSVTRDRLEAVFDGFDFPTAEAREYAEAVMAGFRDLPEGLQTYQQLNGLLSDLGDNFDPAATEAFSDAMRAGATAGRENAFSLSDYIDLLETYRAEVNSDGARNHIDNLLAQAEVLRVARLAQQEATHALEANTTAMRENGAEANAATQIMAAYADIYDRVGSAATEAQTALSTALSQSRERMDIAELDGADAAVAGYFASFGPGGRLVAAARAEVALMREEVTAFMNESGGTLPDGAIADLRAQIEARERLIGQFVTQQEALIRAQSAGSIQTSDNALVTAIREVNSVLPSYSSATQRVVEETIAAARAAADSGDGFIELNAQIDQALANAPSAAPLLERLQSVIAESARTEQSIIATRLSANNLFDNPYGDQASAAFAEMGARVVSGSATVQDLHEELMRLVDEAPHLEERLTSIFTEAMNAMESGDESLFLSRIVDLVDQSGVELARLREEARMTAVAADDAAITFANSFQDVLGTLQEVSGDQTGGINLGISEADIILLTQATAEFQRLNDTAVSVNELGAVLDGLSFPSAEARNFATALTEQFSALPAGQQNYANLNAIMLELGRSYPTIEGSEFLDLLRQSVSEGTAAGETAAAYISRLEGIRDSMPNSELRELIQGLIDAATAKRDAAQAAAQAEGAIIGAGNAAQTAGSQASGAAAGFYQLAAAANAAFSAIANVTANVGSAMADASARLQREIEITGMSDRDAFVARRTDGLASRLQAEADAARAAVQALADGTPARAEAELELNRVLNEQAGALSGVRNEAGLLFDAQEAARAAASAASGGSGGSGGSGSAAELSAEAEALKTLTEGVNQHINSLNAQNIAYSLLITRQTTSETAARTLGEAMAAGVELTEEQTRAIIEQAEAAERLNEQLSILANDPVNAWMDSVPSWIEAGQQIEESAIRAVSDSFKELLKTGEFSMAALAQTIIGAAIDIVADKAVKGLIGLLGGNISGQGEGGFGLGGLLGGLFGGVDESGPTSVFGGGAEGGTEAAMIQAAFTTGGQQAATLIQQALATGGQQLGMQTQQGMTQGGIQAQQQIQMGHQLGGSQAGIRVRTAHSTGGSTVGIRTRLAHVQGANSLRQGVQTGAEIGGSIMAGKIQTASAGAGGGGMGGFGGIFGSLLGLFFSEGGLTSDPSPVNTPTHLPMDMFKNAPHFAEGTTNTSGIPAILHDNEAVVPLSKGRKIPVDMGGEGGSGKTTVINQNISIESPTPREFNNSRTQIGSTLRRAASQGQRID